LILLILLQGRLSALISSNDGQSRFCCPAASVLSREILFCGCDLRWFASVEMGRWNCWFTLRVNVGP
jgi:hypothetical protein